MVYAKSSGDSSSTDMNCVIPNPIKPVCPCIGPVCPYAGPVWHCLLKQMGKAMARHNRKCNGWWYDAHLPSVSIVHGKLTGRLGGILVASRLAHLLKVPQAHLALLSKY